MADQTSLPVGYPTRDTVRELSGEWPDWTYSDLLLEMAAQFDPTERVLDGMTREEKVAFVVVEHDLKARNVQGVPERPARVVARAGASGSQDASDEDSTETSSDVDEPATT